MKKTYVAPAIAIERYELTQTIATCALKIGFVNSTCVENDADADESMKLLAISGYFTDDPKGCGAGNYPLGMDSDDGICYHTSQNIAFNS